MAKQIKIGETVRDPMFVFKLGHFVKKGDRISLAMQNSKDIPVELVAFVAFRSNKTDGDQNFPRPYEINDSGGVIRHGDNVLIARSPLRGMPVICFGAIKGNRILPGMDMFDAEHFDREVKIRENDARRIVVEDDGTGSYHFALTGKNANGNIEIELVGTDDENGRITVAASKDMAFNTPKMYLGEADNEDEPVVLGHTLVEQLKEVMAKLAEPGNIVTPAGPGQFNPTAIALFQRTKIDLEKALSKRNFTV